MIDFEQLRREAAAFGVTLSDEQLQQFDRYAEMLVETNRVMNLTGITDPVGIVTRHFADSLSLFSAVTPAQNASLIDVGSGAGFPGLALAIARPDLHVTLLDSTAKRVRFLQSVADELSLSVVCIHGRAEEFAASPEHRERYDYATARAVSELRTLCEYCLGFVRTGGTMIAYKGKEVQQELALAQTAIGTMGGRWDNNTAFTLSDGSDRCLIQIKKISQTPTKYPRVSAQIAKKPL